MMDEAFNLLGKTEGSIEFQQFRQKHIPESVRNVHEDAAVVCYVSPRDGIELQLTRSGIVTTLFLYVRARGRQSPYTGPLLPDDLRRASKATIRESLGQPERTGTASRTEANGTPVTWDRFQMERGLLHLEYDGADRPALITIMSKPVESGAATGRRVAGAARVSRFADAVVDEGTRLVFIPSLVAVLTAKERRKGAPLTREEVLAIRDNAAVVTIPDSAANDAEEGRGYRDINPEHCWDEWLLGRRT